MTKEDFRAFLEIGGFRFKIYSLVKIEQMGLASLARLPFSIRILLESLIRNLDGRIVTEQQVEKMANWQPKAGPKEEIPFFPARILMQDFTGIPGVVDLAAMRDFIQRTGAKPERVNPVVPVDLVIDHSLEVDESGSPQALRKNMELEFTRNQERYSFLKWARGAFDRFRIFPPGSGIIHQVNLEYIAEVVRTGEEGEDRMLFPDSVLGTDSHTTMINGLGIVGWGVGGIEAEAVMLGLPYHLAIPEVIGVKLHGRLPSGTTATDLVLDLTRFLRKKQVVDKFVEFIGPGLMHLSIPDRATVANMAPEYGATMGYFPVDQRVLNYLVLSGRKHLVSRVETYCRTQRLFFSGIEAPEYSQVFDFDLGEVRPCLVGPSKPWELVDLKDLKSSFGQTNSAMPKSSAGCSPSARTNGLGLQDGSIVIAAITSCTNTSNPALLIAAALLARNALRKGLKKTNHVKTSFTPGSRIVEAYLQKTNLLEPLEALGFHIAGFGCATCIGNSGPLALEVADAIRQENLNVAAVLSGNRNFEARIHPLVKSNYLASPPLVVAFALAGRIDIDLTTEPVGLDLAGLPVFLADIWPSAVEMSSVLDSIEWPELFRVKYESILRGDDSWQDLRTPEGKVFAWVENSSYIRRPPFFDRLPLEPRSKKDIVSAPILLLLGDGITTDHISPAGSIAKDSPAGLYLSSLGITPADFNSYGARRGNHEVMMRGTFANIRLKNKLVSPREGGYTLKFPEMKETSVFNAAMAYKQEGKSLVVIAGREYGTGSSRDWAAKGPALLGIEVVIAQSFERIHRNNLIGMGILPLEFLPGDSAEHLGISGREVFSIRGLRTLSPGQKIKVIAEAENGDKKEFWVQARLDTSTEVTIYKKGGILPYVLSNML